jgi:hypothetical protein
MKAITPLHCRLCVTVIGWYSIDVVVDFSKCHEHLLTVSSPAFGKWYLAPKTHETDGNCRWYCCNADDTINNTTDGIANINPYLSYFDDDIYSDNRQKVTHHMYPYFRQYLKLYCAPYCNREFSEPGEPSSPSRVVGRHPHPLIRDYHTA